MSPIDIDIDEKKPMKKPMKKSKKRRSGKTIIHRTIVIALGLIIIALIAVLISSVFKAFNRGEADNSTDPAPSSEASEKTDPPTEPETDPPTEPEHPISADNYMLSDKDDPEYFDSAVFIGDSTSYGLELYALSERSEGKECLGNAFFLTSGSLSYANLLWDVSDESVHPKYKGTKMKLEESLPLVNPKRIYILLGANDLGLYGVDSTIEHAQTMLGNIQQTCPGATIIVLSTTPKLKAAEERNSSLNNADIQSFNKLMKKKCAEWGYIWLDFSSQFMLDDGSLDPEYCGDPENMGIHFLISAYAKWVSFFEENKVYPSENQVYYTPEQ